MLKLLLNRVFFSNPTICQIIDDDLYQSQKEYLIAKAVSEDYASRAAMLEQRIERLKLYKQKTETKETK
jgi:hypothetical protein